MTPPSPHRRRSRLPRAATTLAVAAAVVGTTIGPAGLATAAETVPAPILSYDFNALTGAGNGTSIADSASAPHADTVVGNRASVVAGVSGNASDKALRLPGGGAGSDAAYVNLAPGLLTSSVTDVTIAGWLRWDGDQMCTWPFTLGSNVDNHVLATTQCGDTGFGAIKSSGEQRSGGNGPVPAARWVHMAVVVDGGTSISTYLDGQLVGTAATNKPASAAVGSSAFSGYLGKSFYGPDSLWAGAIDDFQVWNQALTAGQIQASEADVHQSLAAADATVSLGDTSAVTGDLALPTSGANGSSIAWASSNTSVVSPTGKVTRPAAGQPDATLTLTPTATHGGTAVVGAAISVTVKAYAEGDSPQAELARAVAEAVRTNPATQSPARGSLNLPSTGADLAATRDRANASQAVITWSSSNEQVIASADKGAEPNVVKKGSLTRPAADTTVTLTATVTVQGAAPVQTQLTLTVPAAVDLTQEDMESYMFAYFTGDSLQGEKIRFATADGNNSLQWKTLNGAQPVIESTKGTMGLRDPFILRSKEGDRFFLLATDLSVGRSGWAGSTSRGSAYLEVWESTDLVNWGEQRHIKVNVPTAGMTWAPEAHYDKTIDAYVVYWTSTMYTDSTRTVQDGEGPQIVTSITRDFRDFTTPTPWFKASDSSLLRKDTGLIDSTVLEENGTYYRFTKATQNANCPSADIIGQTSTALRATTASGAWTVNDLCIGRDAGTPEVEGPEIFKANPGDVSPYDYYLWVDNYGGRGYIPLGTNSLQGDIKWTIPSNFSLPASPRHGGILAITAKERDALAAKWNPSLLVSSIAPVATTAPAGSTAEVSLPATVTATFADGHSETVGVKWDKQDLSGLRKEGDKVEVMGTLVNSSATRAVATITATAPPVSVTTSVSPRCVAGKVVVAVSLKNTGSRTTDVTVDTAWGQRTATGLAAGKSVSYSFSTRSASITAGSVTTTASGTTASTAYSATRCD